MNIFLRRGRDTTNAAAQLEIIRAVDIGERMRHRAKVSPSRTSIHASPIQSSERVNLNSGTKVWGPLTSGHQQNSDGRCAAHKNIEG